MQAITTPAAIKRSLMSPHRTRMRFSKPLDYRREATKDQSSPLGFTSLTGRRRDPAVWAFLLNNNWSRIVSLFQPNLLQNSVECGETGYEVSFINGPKLKCCRPIETRLREAPMKLG